MSFPQLPFFSPLRLLPPSSAALVSANYATLTNTTFARLVNRNYGEISGVAPSSLLAYWKMDEVGGDTVNRADSVGSYDFQPSFNSPSGNTSNALLSNVTGKIGNAVYSPTIKATGISTLTNTPDVITIAFWLEVPSGGTVDLGQLIKNPFEIGLNFEIQEIVDEENGNYYFGYFYANSAYLGGVFAGSYYLVVLCHKKSLNTVYFEVFGAGFPVSGSWLSLATTSQDIVFATNELMAVAIDEVGLWSRELTAPEKAALYNGGAGVTYPSVPT